MKLPIKLSVSTDNLRTCQLHLRDADGAPCITSPDGEESSVTVPSDGNVYQGLHRAREGLESMFNEVLAKFGIFPDAAAPPEAVTVPSLEAAEPAKEPPAT